jgi:hypothetical protein
LKTPILIKVLFAGGLNGICAALSFILAHDALTIDLNFALWELGVALCMPALTSFLVAQVSKLGIGILLVIGYLTLFMPVLGASFGASGSEPLWQYAMLGLGGGLVWSAPFAIRAQLRTRTSN